MRISIAVATPPIALEIHRAEISIAFPIRSLDRLIDLEKS